MRLTLFVFNEMVGLVYLVYLGILPVFFTEGLNFTLGFTTSLWLDNMYPGTGIQIALDEVRKQGALLEHNFR